MGTDLKRAKCPKDAVLIWNALLPVTFLGIYCNITLPTSMASVGPSMGSWLLA